ncbi:hypothetical protein [Sphingobium sp.]|uniref:hypothetical protein n=1 Tax=Sphingobium sp. TaxID=1912891 RepID=UPI002D0DB69C|nr:hypothetical protein [Sphingobium sp.]HUD94087.1 hypothetical protein [Sphingobium sp.]
MELKSTDYSYGIDLYCKDSNFSPYAGLLADMTAMSCSTPATPTSIIPVGRRREKLRLDPVKGTSIEAKVRSEWLNGELCATHPSSGQAEGPSRICRHIRRGWGWSCE